MLIIVAFVISTVVAIMIPMVYWLIKVKFNVFIPIDDIIFVPGMASIILYFCGVLFSILSEKESCNNYDVKKAFNNAIKLPISIIVVYLIMVIGLPQLLTPFINITGPYSNERWVEYLAQGIILAAATWPAVAAIWIQAKKGGCEINATKLDNIMEDVDKDLNGPPPNPNKKPDTVPISN